MASDLIHDRGRGPEIRGTRITVYDLMPYFIDPTATEEYICKLYQLTGDQVSAARAYVFNNPDTVLAQHLKIEERMSAGNPPEVIERANRIHVTFLEFKEWLARRDEEERRERESAGASGSGLNDPDALPSFRDWLAEQGSRPASGT